MKKITLLTLVATVAMVSCSNSYDAKKVSLFNQTDSINYALGQVNGAQIKMYYMQGDSSKKTVDQFMQALTDAYEGKVKEESQIEMVGKNIGNFVKNTEKNGVAGNKEWTLNEKLLFQGMVNGMKQDTSMMTADQAREWFQQKYTTARVNMNDSIEVGKAKKATCGKKVKQVKLQSELDSINYFFGYMNGADIAQNVLKNDSTGKDFNALVDAINKGLKSDISNPQLIQMAQQIGKTIKEQESVGLLGIEQIETEFMMIQQGFTNGLSGFEEMMTNEAAGEYVNNAINKIKYGDTQAEGELFLEENKKKEGVITTESGLQYEVLKQGKGKKPAATDKVRVHYHGTLIDGTVFDSSVDRGEPAEFYLNQVIAGWTEGLQLMPEGSKYKFYIPQELGYGSRAAGQIPPFSTLIFEVELLKIVK